MAFLVLALLFAGVKVGGVDFVPKDLIFGAPDPKSRATSDGPLPGECKWDFVAETRIARREEPQGKDTVCIRYYYKTTVELAQTCPDQKEVARSAERITSAGPFCPDASGKVTPPNIDARVLSSGTTADGKHQDIVLQPDGTRITIVSDDAGVVTTVVYPDGTADALKLP